MYERSLHQPAARATLEAGLGDELGRAAQDLDIVEEEAALPHRREPKQVFVPGEVRVRAGVAELGPSCLVALVARFPRSARRVVLPRVGELEARALPVRKLAPVPTVRITDLVGDVPNRLL